jgi:hypothetical protein
MPMPTMIAVVLMLMKARGALLLKLALPLHAHLMTVLSQTRHE